MATLFGSFCCDGDAFFNKGLVVGAPDSAISPAMSMTSTLLALRWLATPPCAVEAEKCDEENDGEYADGDKKRCPFILRLPLLCLGSSLWLRGFVALVERLLFTHGCTSHVDDGTVGRNRRFLSARLLFYSRGLPDRAVHPGTPDRAASDKRGPA